MGNIRTRHQNFSSREEYKPKNVRKAQSKIILDVVVDKFASVSEVAKWVSEYTEANPNIGVICKIGVEGVNQHVGE